MEDSSSSDSQSPDCEKIAGVLSDRALSTGMVVGVFVEHQFYETEFIPMCTKMSWNYLFIMMFNVP